MMASQMLVQCAHMQLCLSALRCESRVCTARKVDSTFILPTRLSRHLKTITFPVSFKSPPFVFVKRRKAGVLLSARDDDVTDGTQNDANEQLQTKRASDVPSNSHTVTEALKAPSFQDGINWFCTSMIVFVTLIDFSPLGPVLQSAPDQAPWLLGAVQWGLFVLPTLNYCRTEGFNLQKTFLLKPCSAQQGVAAGILGASLWLLVSAAIAARAGLDPMAPLPTPDNSPLSSLLATGQPSSLASLLVAAGFLPALAEELLFRGFLLTALQARLGKVDSVALAAALFGLFHLSIPQFFPTTVLGLAAGAVAVASGSVLPAVLLHAGHNTAAIVYGSLASSSGTAPPDGLVTIALVCSVLSAALLSPRKA